MVQWHTLSATSPDADDSYTDDERDDTADDQGITDDTGAGLDADGDVLFLGFDLLVGDKADGLNADVVFADA